MKFSIKFASIVVLAVIGLNVWFTREIIALVRDISYEPTALVAAWFAFTTGELWCLSSIKRKKIEKEGDRNDS